MNRVMVVLLTAALVAGLNLPAAADTRRVADADDASGELDMKWVAHRHGAKPGKVRHRITTYESWPARTLKCSAMGLSFKGRARYLRVYYDGGVRAEMLDTETMAVIGHAKVWRPNRRSLVVQFPKRWLGRSLTRYRWAARTETYGDWCGETADGDPLQHPDTAPNDGWVLHQL